MDLSGVIKQLHGELELINEAIRYLERLEASRVDTKPTVTEQTKVEQPPVRSTHRGRRIMGEAERQTVSERMKRYWDKRRQREAAATR